MPRSISLRGVALITALSLASQTAPARAAWRLDGAAVCVAPMSQITLASVPDGYGGIIVIWKDVSTRHPFAQRLDHMGEPLWARNGVPVSTVAEVFSYDLVAVPDGAGGVFVAWADRRYSTSLDLFAQHLDAEGHPLWGPKDLTVCDAAGDQIDVAMTSDGGEGLILAWRDGRATTAPDIRAQSIGADGAFRWGEDGLAICQRSGYQGYPCITTDGAGGAIVAYLDSWGAGSSIVAQRIGADGYFRWVSFGIVALSSMYQPRIVPDDQGGAFVTAFGYDIDQGRFGMDAQHLDSNGRLKWPGALSHLGDAGPAAFQNHGHAAVSDGQGGLIVAWSNHPEGDLTCIRRHEDGSVVWNAEVAQSSDDSYIVDPVLAADDSAGVIVAWQELGPAGQCNVGILRADAEGQLMWPKVRLGVAGFQERPVVAGDGQSGAMVAWTDGRTPSDYDVYASRVLGSGEVADIPTAIDVSLVESRTDGKVVDLTWHLGTRLVDPTLYRSTDATPWLPVTTLRADGTGLVHYQDAEVQPGVRYHYQLGISVDGQEEFYGLTSVAIPGPTSLRVDGIWPTPVIDRASVAVTLPTSAPARLQILDLAGRVVASRDVSLGIGSHRLDLTEVGWTPGLYLVRLIQAGQIATARATVVR